MEKQPEPTKDESPEPVEVSWQELMDFSIGKATEEVASRVESALEDPGHPLYYLNNRGAKRGRTGTE